MKNFDEVLRLFESPKRISDSSFMAKCPCHADKTQSLSITHKAGKILFFCHAGCQTADIIQAVGLTWSDLGTGQEKPQHNCLERYVYGKRRQFGAGTHIAARYDYTDESGRYLFTKLRLEGIHDPHNPDRTKSFICGVLDERTDTFTPTKGDRKPGLYGLQYFLKAIRQGWPVYYCEGEKDTNTLRDIGLPAITAGGAANWRPEFAKLFKGAQLTVLYDNDQPGAALRDKVLKDAKKYAFATRALAPSQAEHGDISDFLLSEGHTREDLKQLLDGVQWDYASWVNVASAASGSRTKVTIHPGLLAETFRRNEKYLLIRQPSERRDRIYLYDEKKGVYCEAGQNSLKARIADYIPTRYVSDTVLNNAVNLLMANEEKAVFFDSLDADENLIHFRNGLYNIEKEVFGPHDPDVLSTWCLNADYDPDAVERPVFQKFIDDLCRDEQGEVDRDLQNILQEYCGLIISNVAGYRTKSALFLYSRQGNTGKTILLNLLTELLGVEHVCSLPLTEMNAQQRFSVGAIAGKRLVTNGDSSFADVEDSSIFKCLTGGDVLKLEQKFGGIHNLRFTGCIAMAGNGLPFFADDKGNHIYQRLKLIPCRYSIPEEKRDARLLEKMKPEFSAIANWALAGLRRLLKNEYRFSSAASSDLAIEEYRGETDTLFAYLHEGAEYQMTGNTADVVPKLDFERDYLEWCNQEERRPVGKRNIRQRLASYGVPAVKTNIGGRRGIWGYRCMKTVEKDFESVTGKTPFSAFSAQRNVFS